MRKQLFLLALTAAACGARTAQRTLPVEYACADAALVTHGKTIEVREPTASASGGASSSATLGWRDGSGDHFVNWPQSPVDVATVEYVVPQDPRRDATEQVYDTSTGSSRADWRLVRRQVCMARGGYSDALIRYLQGESLTDLAHDFSLADRDEARDLVHSAMITLQKHYFRDH
jgi:hypothetical protein